MASNPSKRLQAVLDALTPQMRKAVLKALDRLGARASVAALERALETGDTVAITRMTSVLPRDLAAAVDTLRVALKAGVKAAAAQVSTSFNADDALSRAAADRTAAAMVTGISDETRRAIRAAVAEAFRGQMATRDVAKLIKPLIGLTERQALAVVKRRAANLAAGMDAAKSAADADRYAAKLMRLRAEMIARTELAKASTAGQIEAWRQARAQGLLSPSLVKTWIVTPDDRLCPYCATLDGVQVPLEGAFTSGKYTADGPPLHPNCRCALGLKAARQARRKAA